jgi:hypothetical protein
MANRAASKASNETTAASCCSSGCNECEQIRPDANDKQECRRRSGGAKAKGQVCTDASEKERRQASE